jgi:hypothetical protein
VVTQRFVSSRKEHARTTRALYATLGGAANVSVVPLGEDDVAMLPKSDMVICYHA